ncbi:MAG: SIR2 family protein [Bacteroidia bacterium]|nr:SIR2 family protein [Bacteroidia bacterium]
MTPPILSPPVEWEAILENISSGKTIVCLGPELLNREGKRLDTLLREAAGGQAKTYDDGLFYFGGSDIVAYSKIKRLYQQPFPGLEEILEKIARIPFQIIISLTPDHHLEKAFENQQFAFQHATYVRRKSAPDITPPSHETPLIYHLLGEIEQRESLVLTHDDLYDFFESVIEHRSMPELLKSRIKEAYNYIFIGLPFEKWYMQLLLRVLGQHTNKNALKYAANHAFDTGIQAFCYEQFNIVCVNDQIEKFVEELHQRCEDLGILRGNKGESSLKTGVLALVKQDRLREAVDKLLDYYETHFPNDSEALNFLLSLSARLTRLENKVGLGSISFENAQVERAKILEDISDFITSMPES